MTRPSFSAAVLSVCVWSAAAKAVETGAPEVASREIQKFLDEHMTDPKTGAIRVNGTADRPVVAGEARNADQLSEALGQMMELAIVRGSLPQFQKQFSLAENEFSADSSRFLAWRRTGEAKADTSATLDDWRVVWACFAASKKWDSPKYAAFAKKLADAIISSSGGREMPPPAFNLGDGSPGAGEVPLCYFHFPAMAESAEAGVPGAGDLLARASKIAGEISGPKGMVPQKWDPETRKFSAGASDEVLALISLILMSDAGIDPELVRDAIEVRKDFFRSRGYLPQAYRISDASALPTPAGASVYALFARLLLRAGDRDTAAAAISKMLEFQNPPTAAYAGAIGGYPVYSFDQLEALLALEEYLSSGNGRGRAPGA